MPTTKRAVILFNETGLSGVQKNEAIRNLMVRCKQDNYKVSRIFYYSDRNVRAPLCKLVRMASKAHGKVTVIFTKESRKPSNNLMIYSALATLAISGQIELCFYEQHINLMPMPAYEAQLMQETENYQKISIANLV